MEQETDLGAAEKAFDAGRTLVKALPHAIRLLVIAANDGALARLRESLGSDGAMQIDWEQALGAAEGLSQLRRAPFDALLVLHDSQQLDGVALAEGLRAGGDETPLVVLGVGVGESDLDGVDALCFEAGADDYCRLADTTVRGLLWRLGRAVDLRSALRDNRRLIQAERQRLRREHVESQRLLDQQRLLLAELEELHDGEFGQPPAPIEAPTSADPWFEVRAADGREAERLPSVPQDLAVRYQDVLQSYVIVGAGESTARVKELAAALVVADVSARTALQIHFDAVQESLDGLGRRSSRHVQDRAKLLAVEFLGHLADSYRERCHERACPPVQLLLPGFLAIDDGPVASPQRPAA